MNKVGAKDTAKYDYLKWSLVGIIIFLGVWLSFVLAQQLQVFRIISSLILGALAVVIIVSTNKGKVAVQFLQDARVEVKKVVWPTRQETVQTTVVVVTMVLVMAVLLWVIDTILFRLMAIFTA